MERGTSGAFLEASELAGAGVLRIEQIEVSFTKE
jgi:hypothetical protein